MAWQTGSVRVKDGSGVSFPSDGMKFGEEVRLCWVGKLPDPSTEPIELPPTENCKWVWLDMERD